MQSSSLSDYSQRVSPADLPELMDGECTYEEFRDCLRSLERVNRWTFGYWPTLSWLEYVLPKSKLPIHVLDVGSGGGDLLRQIAVWARKKGTLVQLTGIDLNPYATRAATEFTDSELGIKWITGDALSCRPERPVDVVASSLTMHHLEDEEIITLLRWLERTAQIGWFLNDLERSERTAKLFGWFAAIARLHRFVPHDGPVSFQRAFSKDDWVRLLSRAGVPESAVTIKQWRPGRLCVGRWKNRSEPQRGAL
jgi:SAM-dependent methyltransferase